MIVVLYPFCFFCTCQKQNAPHIFQTPQFPSLHHNKRHTVTGQGCGALTSYLNINACLFLYSGIFFGRLMWVRYSLMEQTWRNPLHVISIPLLSCIYDKRCVSLKILPGQHVCVFSVLPYEKNHSVWHFMKYSIFSHSAGRNNYVWFAIMLSHLRPLDSKLSTAWCLCCSE